MWNLIVAYVLGIISAFVLILLLLTHRAPAPTLAARRKMGKVEDGQEDRGVNYQWVNLTGEEQ